MASFNVDVGIVTPFRRGQSSRQAPSQTHASGIRRRSTVPASQTVSLNAKAPVNISSAIEQWERVTHPLAEGPDYFYNHASGITTTRSDADGWSEVEKGVKRYILSPAGDDHEWFHDDEVGELFLLQHKKEWARRLISHTEDPIRAPQLEDISIAKYWELIKRRPYHLAHKLSPDAASRAFNALTLITSYHIFDPRTPISPFSKAECKELCEILLTQTPGQGHDSTRNIFDYRTYTVASILEKIYAQRHWRRAALVEHRLEDGSSRSGSKPNRIKNYLKKVVSLVLLEVPVHYEKQIERATRVRIDREMPRHVWREIINKLKNEWSLFIAISAVLLASTVATLAIPGIDSLTRLFAGIAAQCAFSSIVMGISLLWQYVGTLEDDGIMGAIYFKRDPWGIACLQALPLAALLWSLATFAVAGCIYPFRSRDGDPAAEHDDRQGDGGPHSVLQPAQKGIAGITMGLLAIAILAIFYDVVTTKHGAVKADSPKLREIVPQTGNPVEQAKQAKQAKQAGGGAPIVDTPSPSIAVTIRSESPQGL